MPEASNLKERRTVTHFRCAYHREIFHDYPVERVEDAPGEPHPYRYFAFCPKCADEGRVTEMTEPSWMRNLYKAHTNLTGTKSPEKSVPPEGKVWYGNLRTGEYARQAKCFPARPGKYPECEGCRHKDVEVGTEPECKEAGYCLEITKLFMRVQHAVDNEDPKALNDLFTRNQVHVQVLIQRMFTAIGKTGVELSAPKVVGNKYGYDIVRVDGEVVMEYSAHPLIKPLIEMMAKNNMTLGDWNMTPGRQKSDEQIQGFLDGKTADIGAFIREQQAGQAALLDMFDQAKKRRADDPVYQDLLAQQSEGEGKG